MKSSTLQKWSSPSRMFHRLRHIHIENKGLKLMAFVLAILLFVISRQPITNVRLSGVPLEFRGLTQGVEISSDVQPTVSLLLRGPRDVVRSLTPNQLSVIANLSNKEPGERVVQLRPEDVNQLENVKVLQIEPASIRLRLELIESKSVAIEPQFMGQVGEGLEIYKVNLEPPTVEIEGPHSQINKINYVLTETINLSGKQGDFRASVDVETPHNSIRVKTPAPISLSVLIGERRSARHFTHVPIRWPDQHPRDRLLTKTVDVVLYGPESALEKLQAGDLHIDLKMDTLRPAIDGAETARPEVRLPATADKHIEVKKIIPSEVRLKRQ